MENVQVGKLKVGERFGTRRGNEYTVLEIDKDLDPEGEVIKSRDGVPKMLLRIHDHQTDKRYQVRYMGTDEVLRIEDAPKPAKK